MPPRDAPSAGRVARCNYPPPPLPLPPLPLPPPRPPSRTRTMSLRTIPHRRARSALSAGSARSAGSAGSCDDTAWNIIISFVIIIIYLMIKMLRLTVNNIILMYIVLTEILCDETARYMKVSKIY